MKRWVVLAMVPFSRGTDFLMPTESEREGYYETESEARKAANDIKAGRLHPFGRDIFPDEIVVSVKKHNANKKARSG